MEDQVSIIRACIRRFREELPTPSEERPQIIDREKFWWINDRNRMSLTASISTIGNDAVDFDEEHRVLDNEYHNNNDDKDDCSEMRSSLNDLDSRIEAIRRVFPSVDGSAELYSESLPDIKPSQDEIAPSVLTKYASEHSSHKHPKSLLRESDDSFANVDLVLRRVDHLLQTMDIPSDSARRSHGKKYSSKLAKMFPEIRSSSSDSELEDDPAQYPNNRDSFDNDSLNGQPSSIKFVSDIVNSRVEVEVEASEDAIINHTSTSIVDEHLQVDPVPNRTHTHSPITLPIPTNRNADTPTNQGESQAPDLTYQPEAPIKGILYLSSSGESLAMNHSTNHEDEGLEESAIHHLLATTVDENDTGVGADGQLIRRDHNSTYNPLSDLIECDPGRGQSNLGAGRSLLTEGIDVVGNDPIVYKPRVTEADVAAFLSDEVLMTLWCRLLSVRRNIGQLQ